MMLQHLGHQDAHDTIMQAVEDVLKDGGNLTRDMGGKASTEELGKAIEAAI
jgi:tartrate dehydrogenase/decarboxylase/D-malate dehydrogenase